MTKDAKEAVKVFDLITTACAEIKNCNRCEDCPLKYLCIEEVAAVELADFVSTGAWDEFLAYADSVEFRDEDLEAQHADFMRKYEQEERMIDEYYG